MRFFVAFLLFVREKKYERNNSGQRSLQYRAVRSDDTERRRRLYRRQDQHACRLAYDEQIRIAVRQIGKSRPIPQSRLGRMDQQKHINRQGGVIRPVYVSRKIIEKKCYKNNLYKQQGLIIVEI